MAAKTRNKRRGRPAGKPLSRRELQARRKNLVRARSAPKEWIYRLTEKRIKASLRNLRKAIAERRRDAGLVRLNALKHGVYSREWTRESVRKLGEDPREFEAHHDLFVKMLVPRTPDETVMVWELANLAWRRLRLFRAAAERERRDLRALIESFDASDPIGPPGPLDASETLERMYLLFATLDGCNEVLRDARKLRQEMRNFFDLLIEGRTPAKAKVDEPPWEPPKDILEDLPDETSPPTDEKLEGGEEFKDEV